MRRIVSLVLAGVLVASQAPCARGQAAPALSDRDRKVIADLVRDLGKPDDGARVHAARALAWIGPAAREAVPALVAMLKDEDGHAAWAAAAALVEIGADHPLVGPALVEALGDPKPEARIAAMSTIELFFDAGEEGHLKGGGHDPGEVDRILPRFGPAGRRIVPILVENLKADDPKVREAAVSLLWDMGPPAVAAIDALIDALSDPVEDVRVRVPDALISVGPDSGKVVPALLRALKSDDLNLRSSARDALATRFRPSGRYQEPRAPADLPPLIAALKDRDRSVRATSAFCLWEIREQAEPAIPALSAALVDRDEEVRILAAATLIARRPQDRRAASILVAALPRLDGEDRDESFLHVNKSFEFYAEVLCQLGPEAGPRIPRLIRAGLDSRAQSARPERAARSALIKLGPVAVPALIGALGDEDRALRRLAAGVLGAMGTTARPAVPALSALLDDGDEDLANSAGFALKRLGPAAREAVPALRQRLQAADPSTRVRAADILSAIDPDPKLLMPILEEAVKKGDRPARLQAISALGRMGAEALPLLSRVLRDPKSSSVREDSGAYEALVAIDPSRKAADSVLIAMLEDGDPEVRTQGARIIVDIGREAGGGCVPALERALNDRDSLVHRLAASALVAIDPGNKEVLSYLLKALAGGEESNDRRVAANLLGDCGEHARGAIPALRRALDDPDREVRDAAASALWSIDRDQVPIHLRPRVMTSPGLR